MSEPLIVPGPAVTMGKPVVAGTRVTMEHVLEELALVVRDAPPLGGLGRANGFWRGAGPGAGVFAEPRPTGPVGQGRR